MTTDQDDPSKNRTFDRSVTGRSDFALRIERNARGLERLGFWVDEIAAAMILPPSTEYALRLCLEEAVANVVMHGIPAPGTDASTVTLRVDRTPEVLHLTVEDQCAGFNPLAVPSPSAPTAYQDMPIGGQGVHLMRQFAQKAGYARDGDVNRLTLIIAEESGVQAPIGLAAGRTGS